MRKLFWISSLYFSQGLPYVLVTVVSSVLYKTLNIANAKIAFFTSLLFLPWTLKPFWAPLLETHYSKKQWLVRLQYVKAGLLVLLVGCFFLPHYFYLSIIIFLLFAFCSASYDIVSDGYYMLELDLADQRAFIGFRSLFYQSARLFTQGVLLMIAGYLMQHFAVLMAWQISFILVSIILLVFACWHQYILIDQERLSTTNFKQVQQTFVIAFKSFLTIPHFVWVLIFLIIFNAADAQLIKIVPLFLLDSHGLALTTGEVGWLYGGMAGAGMILGATLGGFALNRWGIKDCLTTASLLMLIFSINYLLLALLKIKLLWLIALMVFLPQLFFGLANSAYMGFLLNQVAHLPYKTTCYALATGIMCFSYLFFGAISGFIEQYLGYRYFFMLIFLLELGVFLLTLFINRKVNYGFNDT